MALSAVDAARSFTVTRRGFMPARALGARLLLLTGRCHVSDSVASKALQWSCHVERDWVTHVPHVDVVRQVFACEGDSDCGALPQTPHVEDLVIWGPQGFENFFIRQCLVYITDDSRDVADLPGYACVDRRLTDLLNLKERWHSFFRQDVDCYQIFPAVDPYLPDLLGSNGAKEGIQMRSAERPDAGLVCRSEQHRVSIGRVFR